MQRNTPGPGVREIARTCSEDLHSPAAGKGKLVRSNGGMWILRLVKLSSAAIPKPAQRIGRVRRVPLIPDARALFERMRRERAGAPLNEKVFRVREAQRAINQAANKVGIAR